MTVAQVIDYFKTAATYTVTRTAASTTDTKGRRVAGATSTFTIVACIQPVSDRDLKLLPEALHTEDLRKVFTTTLLKGEPRPDSIAIDGEAWLVVGRPPRWNPPVSTHYEAIVSRQVVP